MLVEIFMHIYRVTPRISNQPGDSSSVQARLQNTKVQRLVATCGAVAALLEDGQVVTWGNARQGGDSTLVENHGEVTLVAVVRAN